MGVLMLVYLAFVFFAPNFFLEPDNYIEANPLQTPPHIVPEWYLMPFYAILRAFTQEFLWIPAKVLGVIAMFASVGILALLPWLDTSKVRSARFRPIYKQVFWLFFVDCLVLGYVGANPPEGYLILLGQVATAYYFLHFLVVMPVLGIMEKTRPVPDSISAAVTPGGTSGKEDT
jgi:quinol-cytochrome oxidoreductase complex cytochrome b subunit